LNDDREVPLASTSETDRRRVDWLVNPVRSRSRRLPASSPAPPSWWSSSSTS